ncbi:MAG: sugar isomerase domain-containing protein [Streptomycetaceae bacterium]|jgi:uncharacterized phosphosugar-binding protein|nr:MAG: sugar isomerase domain-containing protein [Streptomycetaceae bacterium]
MKVEEVEGIDSVAIAELIAHLGLDAVRRQLPEIKEAAQMIFAAVTSGGNVFTFGAGHAQSLAMEFSSRAGGLAIFQSMHLQDIRTERRDAFWDLRDSQPERIPENGIKVLDHHKIKENDLVIIASQSGRNGAIVEMAIECKKRGIKVIGLSSSKHSQAVDSRHPSGLMLSDVVDLSLDNGSVIGDAVAELPDGKSICSASTVCFVLIAQAINAEVTKLFLLYSLPVPLLISANLDHGDKSNSPLKFPAINI